MHNTFYSNDAWRDQLTSYDGSAITYDEIGNPLEYINGLEFEWSGRRLTKATKNNVTYTFTYDDEGRRTSKSNGNVTTHYYYSGNSLIAEASGNGEIVVYIYDSFGAPVGFGYRQSSDDKNEWEIFFYEKNVQGDIVGIYTTSGTVLVKYAYDAWGNIAETTYYNGGASTNVIKNNLLYRGYVYDSDLELYCLKTRYYDSETGRFISPDDISYLGANGDLNAYNLYAYCFNNPVMYSDPNGNWPSWLTKLVVAVAVVAAVAVAAAVTVATAGAGSAVAVVAVGAAKGAAIGLATGAASGAAIGYITTGTLEGTLNGMADGALSGSIAGAVTGGITGGIRHISNTTSAGKGFDTYRQLKKEIGSPGVGNEWHHIVEQSQIAKSGFNPQLIQNTNNVVSISQSTHRAISGYYSSIQPFTNGMIVRNWLAGQSFSAQYQFGINVIKMFM